jgi:gliding motility-associated-like protein
MTRIGEILKSVQISLSQVLSFGKFAGQKVYRSKKTNRCKHADYKFLFGEMALLFLLILPTMPVVSQPFQKIYTSPPSQLFVAEDLFADADGQCRITGEWWLDRPKTFVLKTDADGLPVWSRAFSPTDASAIFPSGISIAPTSDNGLAVSALKEKNGETTGGALLKISDTGNLEWAKLAPCVWRSSKVCAADGHIYYAATGQGTRKVFLSKITDNGQVMWERLLEADAMDLYTVVSLVPLGNGDLALALKVAKFHPGGVGPENTVLFRIDPAGAVKKVAYFPLLLLAALEPFADGRIAFRCSTVDVTWTGIGMMDSDFNWLWFKKSRLASMILLPNILNSEVAKSRDETQLVALFYTPGGEKMALTFDTDGGLLDEQVYFSAPYSEKAATAGAKGYVRASGIRADAFVVTKMADDGASPSCFFPQPCGLILEDENIKAGDVNWAVNPTVCLQMENVVAEDMPVQAADFCFAPGPLHAAFSLSDTVICAGETIDIQRNAGIGDIQFGLSRWTFQGGIPGTATSASVKNIRFNQPGNYLLTHIFNVAGCTDTTTVSLAVLSPPEPFLTADTTICEGDTVHLLAGVAPSETYLWSTGDTSVSIAANLPGTYSVTVTNAGGCTAASATAVSLLSAQAVFLGNDTIFCRGKSVRIQPSEIVPGSELLWNTGDAENHLDVSESGIYTVTASASGCSFSDTIVVEMQECADCQVYAPTVFAPGGSSPNEVFRLFPGCQVSAVRLQIFDRWGNLIFISDKENEGWDGTHGGKRMPPGVYVFFAEMQIETNLAAPETRMISGNVTLIR